jgi:hypothetical protein
MTVINTSQANMSRFNTGLLLCLPSSTSTLICDENTAQKKKKKAMTPSPQRQAQYVLVCQRVF